MGVRISKMPSPRAMAGSMQSSTVAQVNRTSSHSFSILPGGIFQEALGRLLSLKTIPRRQMMATTRPS